ncbi:MAG: nicotinamide riboside transporter PnuC [Gammaproteobacteria bacterium]|tara:strand:+ start:3960 stop:4541 length:582 start_codon:yes stop_codon:yes gene_type:complete
MIFNFLTENWFEIVAALLAIAYLLLAMRQDARCWIAWIISSLMYLFVMYSAGLYMEAGLQIFYLLMGFYGLYQWQYKLANNEALKIKVWPITTHMMCLTALFLLVITSGYILSNNTDAASPYIDAFTTWGAIIASYMVAKKILENWIYWFVIDFVSVFLFVSRELYPTALLFCLYLVLVIIGYRSWKNEWQLK